MIIDYTKIPGIADRAVGSLGNELTFTFPEVLRVVSVCSENEIAVLGVDLFEVRAAGYATKKLSAYSYDQATQKHLESTLRTSGWRDYVNASNALAEEFIRQNPAGDDHVYILSTSSRKEFGEIQEIKQQWTRHPHK